MVAQLVERVLCKHEVRGSIPLHSILSKSLIHNDLPHASRSHSAREVSVCIR